MNFWLSNGIANKGVLIGSSMAADEIYIGSIIQLIPSFAAKPHHRS
jgi:hypothetical protein